MGWLWSGGEDEAGFLVGATTVVTTSTYYRSTYCRCAIGVTDASIPSSNYYQTPPLALTGSWWIMGSVYMSSVRAGGNWLMTIMDASANVRLIVLINTSTGTVSLQKRNAAGTTTTLNTSSSSFATAVINRLDVFINYAVSGQFTFYVNGGLIVNYAGDVTTDSLTSLTGGSVCYGNGGGAGGDSVNKALWSECRVDTVDTRGISAQFTSVPAANGNTDAWDVGGVTNINPVTINPSTNNASGTAAQLQEYTIGAPPTGNWTLRDYVISQQASIGESGPQNIQGDVRTGGTSYQTSDASPAPQTAIGPVQEIFITNPNTSVPWVEADIAAVGFNIGMKSAA